MNLEQVDWSDIQADITWGQFLKVGSKGKFGFNLMTHRWRNYKTKLILHKLTLDIYFTYLFLFSFFTFRIQSNIKSCICHCCPKWGGGRPFISLSTYLKSIKIKLKLKFIFILIKVFISIKSNIERVFPLWPQLSKKGAKLQC